MKAVERALHAGPNLGSPVLALASGLYKTNAWLRPVCWAVVERLLGEIETNKMQSKYLFLES